MQNPIEKFIICLGYILRVDSIDELLLFPNIIGNYRCLNKQQMHLNIVGHCLIVI